MNDLSDHHGPPDQPGSGHPNQSGPDSRKGRFDCVISLLAKESLIRGDVLNPESVTRVNLVTQV